MMFLSERSILEKCLSACKGRLDQARMVGNELEEALAEADLNAMLERLAELHKGRAT